MKADWPRLASGSALPWPKRCSRSGGVSAWRTAIRLTSEAAPSNRESIRLDSRLTESVANQAPSFTTTSSTATASEA